MGGKGSGGHGKGGVKLPYKTKGRNYRVPEGAESNVRKYLKTLRAKVEFCYSMTQRAGIFAEAAKVACNTHQWEEYFEEIKDQYEDCEEETKKFLGDLLPMFEEILSM